MLLAPHGLYCKQICVPVWVLLKIQALTKEPTMDTIVSTQRTREFCRYRHLGTTNKNEKRKQVHNCSDSSLQQVPAGYSCIKNNSATSSHRGFWKLGHEIRHIKYHNDKHWSAVCVKILCCIVCMYGYIAGYNYRVSPSGKWPSGKV